jgi:hypothetical protein
MVSHQAGDETMIRKTFTVAIDMLPGHGGANLEDWVSETILDGLCLSEELGESVSVWEVEQ